MSRLCKAELSEVDAIKSILLELIKDTLLPSKFYVIGPTLINNGSWRSKAFKET